MRIIKNREGKLTGITVLSCEVWPEHVFHPHTLLVFVLGKVLSHREFCTLGWSHDCTIKAGKGKEYFPSLFFFPCAAWRLIFLQRRLQWVGCAEGSALTELYRRLCSGNPNPQWPLTFATAATSAPESERERKVRRDKESEEQTLRYSEDGEGKLQKASPIRLGAKVWFVWLECERW